MSGKAPFPPPGSLSRSVLVRNVSHRASEQTIDDFFSFCGSVVAKRIKVIPPGSASSTSAPTNTSKEPILEAYVVFESERAQQNAILLDGSTILDQRVSIIPAPAKWDDSVVQTPSQNGRQNAGGIFSFLPGPAAGALKSTTAGVSNLFGEVGQVLNQEYAKAATALKQASETGVLKKAKDQAIAATVMTKRAATELDERYAVSDRVMTAAQVGKTKAQEAASVLATQTKSVAATVDRTLHVSEKTNQLASKAMENEAVASGYNTIVQGFNTFWKTALQNSPTEDRSTERPAQPSTSPTTL